MRGRLVGRFAGRRSRMWCWIWAAARASTPWRARSCGLTCCSSASTWMRVTLRAAEAASAVGVDNAVFLMDGVPSFEEHPEQAHASRASEGRAARSGAPAEIDLSTVFAVGELSALLMNFPTPFPEKEEAHLRLDVSCGLSTAMAAARTRRGHPLAHRQPAVARFSLTQLELAMRSRGEAMTFASSSPMRSWSAYERKLTEQGACAFGIAACPVLCRARGSKTAPLSLEPSARQPRSARRGPARNAGLCGEPAQPQRPRTRPRQAGVPPACDDGSRSAEPMRWGPPVLLQGRYVPLQLSAQTVLRGPVRWFWAAMVLPSSGFAHSRTGLGL